MEEDMEVDWVDLAEEMVGEGSAEADYTAGGFT